MNFWWSLLLVLVIVAAWIGWNYWRLRRAAKMLESDEFAAQLHTGQVVDLRAPESFREKHIMGARNIPYEQLKMSTGALRKDKPVLLYEGEGTTRVTPAALYLKKQGYKTIYVLAGGINSWTGKLKTK